MQMCPRCMCPCCMYQWWFYPWYMYPWCCCHNFSKSHEYSIYFQYPGKEYSPRTTATNQPTFSLIHFSGCGHNMFRVQNGPFFGPKVWVVGYKLQPYWTTWELGWRSDWELKVNVVEHTGNQRQVTGVRVGLVIDSGSVLAPCILLWPDSKANIFAQSIPPFCNSFINKNTNNARIANAVQVTICLIVFTSVYMRLLVLLVSTSVY